MKATFYTAFLILFMSSLSISVSANENEQRLTGLEIEEHFKTLEKLYTAKTPDMIAIADHKAEYTADDFIVHNVLRSNLGDKIIENTQSRQQFLLDAEKQVADTKVSLLNAKLIHELDTIEYNETRTTADVTYRTFFSGEIHKPDDKNQKIMIAFKSQSACTELFKLQKDVLKSYKVECHSDITYAKPRKLG